MEATKKVAGRYVLQEPLGRGGMGAVWRARDEVLKRDIALKEVQVPHSIAGTEGQDVEERVLREARAAARLSHPSATTVYDVFQEDGKTFIAMELVDAPTLGEIVAEHGPLEPHEVARIGLALLDALNAAHAVGMVHRDVKPDNVMVTDSGQVKLTDFGIASVKGDPKLTMSGVILGSPSYMAPEQADGKGAGIEADLWSLGATLFFAVEGHAPFKKDSPIATLAAVVGDPAPVPQRAGGLEPLISGLLAKDPKQRPTSASLHRDLERLAVAPTSTSSSTQVIAPPAATQVDSAPQTRPEPRHEEPSAPRYTESPSKSRGGLLVVGVIAVLLLGALVFALMQGDDEEPTEQARQRNQQGQGGGREEDPESTPADEEEEPPVTEEGWTTYPVADTGYTISYPEGWEVSESGSQVTFSDPLSATSMLVEHTYSPGDDAVAAWEAQAADFATKHDNYSEITIEETTFEGFDTAANWEFTYTDGGLDLHALDIGLANEDTGFALFFQTAADEWDAQQSTLQQFTESFGRAT